MSYISLPINLNRLSFLFLFVFGLSISVFSQADDSYKATKAGWLVDIDEAYAESQRTGKPVLANFTGSDWCGWCKKLDKSVFNKETFKTWAKDNVILLELDFPRRSKLPQAYQKQNNNLKQAFKVRGFPTIWVFDLSKDENGQFAIKGLGKTGYTKTVEQFTNDIENMIAKRS